MHRTLILGSASILAFSLANSQEESWPRPFPCRTGEGSNNDIFIMTLGNVRTPLANGVFDPSKDELRLSDGGVIRNYYRDSLGVKYYAPIDKTRFPLPPSGWCSWYYYYQEIDENEIRKNAQWIGENLKEYGARYVQIDDGWQGSGHGMGENRDWTTVDKRFPHGMDSLALFIKRLGFQAGLWLAPHGQSNPDVVKRNPGVFLLTPEGVSASDTWEGKFLVDPSAIGTQDYLNNLFETLSHWGYDYFKIDGQPIVIDQYRKTRSFMRVVSPDTDDLYRKTLRAIRSAIGDNRYLLGCWGIPLEGAGIMNGSRTGGDIVPGWEGFKTALEATMKYYYLHNVVWYCDPDVMLVRSPLTLDQARAWATLQGLTGQALMASDRMMDLSGDRVDLLRRVYPAVDIRPLDLFASRRQKHIWDLKVNHLDRNYDVVGLFNFDEGRTQAIYLGWKDVGIPDTVRVHVFDFWNEEYLGCWEAGISLELAPTSCRVLTLLPERNRIELISTNRHITQGWVDLVALSYDRESIRGRSRLIGNDPYELRFAFPRGRNFRITKAEALGHPLTVTNHQGWSRVQVTSSVTREVDWRVSFEPVEAYSFPVHPPTGLSFEPAGLDAVLLRWNPQYYLTAGYVVTLDGRPLGYTPTNVFAVPDLDPRREYHVQVASIWDDGRTGAKKADLKFTLATTLPAEMYLSDLAPVRATVGWGSVGMDKAVTGKPLSVAGKKYQRGIGTHANSEIEYDLHGLFEEFKGAVGIDEGNNSEKGTVEFVVLTHGKERWRSGVMRRSAPVRQFRVDVKRVHALTLRVLDAGDGIDYDHADWLEARVER